MKYLLSIFVMFLAVSTAVNVQAQAKPKIVFDKQEYNFGSFKESAGVQTTTFEFTNKGNVPLILNNVQASCGCTTPEWTREPVAPGSKGKIQVSYNPANRPGAFSKTVTVMSNAETPTVILTISGKVEEREKTLAELYPQTIGNLRAKQSYISFVTLKQNDVKTETLELINDTDQPIAVGFKQVPSHIKAQIEPTTIPSKGKGILTVTYDAKAAGTLGFASHRIYLNLNGENNYNNSIGVSATIEEDFSTLTPQELANAPVASFDSESVDMGDLKQGAKGEHTFTLKNNGKRELIIRKVNSSCGCTAVSPSKNVVAPGESVPIKVVFDSTGKKGRQSKTVTVITNDPKNPTVTLRVSSNITV